MSVDIDRFALGKKGRMPQNLMGDSVTYTDLKGRITYANHQFIEGSGFTHKELLGATHNIIRHRDVPSELYKDLWATISAGKIWTGVLKNRRKDGQAYWSKTTITPFFDADGKPIGYKAIRVKPTPQEIKKAEAAFQNFKARKQGYQFKAGVLIRRGPLSWIKRLSDRGQRRLYLVLIVLSVFSSGLLVQALSIEGAIAALCVIAGTICVATDRYLLKPQQKIVDGLNRLASGDLSVRFKESHTGFIGNLQHALDLVTVNLRTIVQDVKERTTVLGGISHKIIESNSSLAKRTESTTVSLRNTTESMHSIGSTALQSSDSATNSVAQSRHGIEVAQRGHSAVEAINDAMEQIVESSRKIGSITKLIESIAFQTNLLALNASIEAAQAGAMGRGFAVVAAEVRALAQSTSNAVLQIKEQVEESAGRVATGHELTVEAGLKIQEVITAVEGISAALSAIDISAREQQQGIFLMGDALDTVGAITEENAMMVYEFAELGEVLESHSQDLIKSMQIFRL